MVELDIVYSLKLKQKKKKGPDILNYQQLEKKPQWKQCLAQQWDRLLLAKTGQKVFIYFKLNSY